ncbi:hypothetical protein HF325_004218 [Metschnikowia pulcherrima]|uniref:Uncharacterized protein n=1 Tax=Metschnikowia pulcherrima TaxID=27326 RepID=A0A8H7GSE6_9ASCO|nr:hypothetical protein HF325_004218 [Metschnikowia pulcherrima]
MDYDQFFRPVGLALDVMANLQFRLDMDGAGGARQADQAAVAEAIRVPHTLETRRHHGGQLVRPVWCFGFLPLPAVNYTLLWRRYGPSDLRQAAIRTSEIISLVIKTVFRALIYIASVYYWLRFVFTSISTCGNMVTYSQSFFWDIFTFSLRNYPSLLERHAELLSATKVTSQPTISMDSLQQVMFDAAALKIHVSCILANETTSCELMSDSLIFKLCDILTQCYPFLESLPLVCLTLTTICLYILYALGAQVLNINIVCLVTYITWKRQFPLTKFVIELIKTVWLGSVTNVI